MKIIDWIITLSLMLIGLSCLTMSATWLLNPETIHSYLATVLQICLWAGVPVFFASLIYLIFKRKK